MHNEHSHTTDTQSYTFKDFMPLIAAFSAIALFVVVRQWWYGTSFSSGMYDAMAGFFLLFGSMKLLDLKGFAQAYATYDVLAKKSTIYAYAYPFIELVLGMAYLWRLYLNVINVITLVLMLVSAVGVAHELRQQRPVACACLGTVFKLPMTYITLIEDLAMAAMAALMLVI